MGTETLKVDVNIDPVPTPPNRQKDIEIMSTELIIPAVAYVAGVATSAIVLKYATKAASTIETDAKAVNADVQADATDIAKKL